LTHTEGETAHLALSRVGGFAGVLSVGYTIENVTRTGRDNFGLPSGTVTWADGDAANKYVLVPLKNDGELAALKRTATHCNALQHTAMHCTALQCTAMHCHTLQHMVAMHCNALRCTAMEMCGGAAED